MFPDDKFYTSPIITVTDWLCSLPHTATPNKPILTQLKALNRDYNLWESVSLSLCDTINSEAILDRLKDKLILT